LQGTNRRNRIQFVFEGRLKPSRQARKRIAALQAAEKLVNAGGTVEERRFSAA